MLVQVAPAKLAGKIRRSGIKPSRHGGVYAFPVLSSHTITHQWTREIGKRKPEPLVGVYFRVPDAVMVRFGHYGRGHRHVRADVATSELRKLADPLGYQIILADPVPAEAITRIAPLRAVIGWRHFPDAHGKRPCECPYCLRGERGVRRFLARAAAKNAKLSDGS